MKAVVILSGGLDSTVLLYDLVAQGADIKALSFDYGQKHDKEVSFARDTCSRMGIPFTSVSLGEVGKLLQGSSSLLMESVPIPEGHYESDSMRSTVVPNRNMIMLSVAIGHCVAIGYDTVAYAAHGGDHAIYPDCRPEFVAAMGQAAGLCDWKRVAICAPYLSMRKADIVTRGIVLGVPFGDTWSCYKGGDMHCGKCGTCDERREAFATAGVLDPTRYEEGAE